MRNCFIVPISSCPHKYRTIAPIIGRTPIQCLEHYEKLLDASCAKDETMNLVMTHKNCDLIGEIDQNPESKPARPDPVDMDEDEKEMFSEARTWLASTRGKKAKRLASLQKRELNATGIDSGHRMRKRKGIV